jgi:hypothetical protein
VLGDSLARSAQPQMSARHANRRKSNCCDSVARRSICIHSCQCEIERRECPRAHFSSAGSLAVDREPRLRFGFAIGRPNGIAPAPIAPATHAPAIASSTAASSTAASPAADVRGARHTHHILTSDASSTRRARIRAASVLASRAPVSIGAGGRIGVDLAIGAAVRDEAASDCSLAPRVRINLFEALYFRSGASGRLSTAMIDMSQRWIGSTGLQSTGDIDRASDCADVSARWDVSRDDRRFNRGALALTHVGRAQLARRHRVGCDELGCNDHTRQRATRSGAPSGSHPNARAA